MSILECLFIKDKNLGSRTFLFPRVYFFKD